MSVRFRTPVKQALGILLFGIAAGLAGNQISPRGLPVITAARQTLPAEGYIALDKAKELWQLGSALFLDAREPADYAVGHIGNALNLPASSFAQHFGEVAPFLTPESQLVLYCDGKDCDLSLRLTESLRQLGYTNSHILLNGWTEWRKAGLPTTPGVLR